MSRTEDELRGLLYQARDMPFGNAQTALVEQVVAHAEADQHEELAYEARMQATASYTFGGEPAKAFVTFSRCLSEFDQQPRPYHQQFATELLWQFKWIINAMTNFPEVPLDRAVAALDDMERRYRVGGYSQHAVLTYRHRIAAHIGDQAAADDWYERWCAAPVDELSDCRACDPGAKVRHLAERGRDEEAVALAEPVVTGAVNCLEQPQSILTDLLIPYTRTGRHEQAVGAHRRAYRALRGARADLAAIAEQVAFCGRTGNEPRGLELLQRHLGWLDTPPSPAAAMEFAASAALVLARLTAAGQGDLPVHRPAFGDRLAAEVPVGRLGTELAELATSLAARFDARNQTGWQGDRVAALLAAEPLVDYLPLSPTASRRVTASRPPANDPPAPPDPPAVPAGGAHSAIDEFVEAVAAATAAGDEAAGSLARLALAEAYLRQGRPVEAAETAEEGLAMVAADAQPGHRDQLRELLVFAYGALGEVAPALAQTDALVASYGGFDHASSRGRLQEQAGELLWNVDQDAEAAVRFTAASGEYATADDPIASLRTQRRAMLAHHYAGDLDAALAALAEVDARAGGLPAEPAAQWEAAMIGYDGARLLAGTGRLDDAAVRLEPVADRFQSVGAFDEALQAELLRGDILLGDGRPDQAVPVLRLVTDRLPRSDPRLPQAAWLLATALTAIGDQQQAAEVRQRYGVEDDEE